MKGWKIILATLVIFGTGVVTGGLLLPRMAHIGGHQSSRGNSAWHTGGPGSAIGLKIEFLRRVQHELDLTPDQHARIDRILGESQERARKLMDPVRAQLQAEVKRAKEEFLEVLTPEQRPRFEELWKQQRRQREQHEQHEQRRAPPSAERPSTNPAVPAS